MSDQLRYQTIIEALARSEMGLSPGQLLMEPEVDALYNHVGDLQIDLEELVSDGMLRCRESPGSLRYVVNRSSISEIAMRQSDHTGSQGRGRVTLSRPDEPMLM